MKVKDIMIRNLIFCHLHENLDIVVQKMEKNNVGILPVVNKERKLKTVITDRDICMASALLQQTLDKICVKQIAPCFVVKCTPEDDIKQALRLMKKHRIRRIPVANEEDKISGIISLADIAAVLEHSHQNANILSCADFLMVLTEITKPISVTKRLTA